MIAPDYMTTGAITSYARDGNLFGQQADRQRQIQVADAIRASILKTDAPDDADLIARAFGPTAHITRMRLTQRRPHRARPTTCGVGAIRRDLRSPRCC